MLDLLLRLGKDRKQFDHYLHDDLRHQGTQRDPGINFEAFEEAPDALKEFKESVIARADSFSRLVVILEGDGRPTQMIENTHGKEDVDTNEDHFCRFERNLVGKELKKRTSKERSRFTRLAASSRIPEKA